MKGIQAKPKAEKRKRAGKGDVSATPFVEAGDDGGAGPGVFTETFMCKQASPPKKFQWQQIFNDYVDNVECSECGEYFKEGCRRCRYIHRQLGYPSSKEDIQHPTFYSTWGGKHVEIGGAELRFFKR